MFTLANMSLELMAPSGEGPAGERVRAALDKQGEGLASLAFAVADITKAHRRLTRLGLAPDDIADGESLDLASGASMSWQRIRASDDFTHGVRMFFLQRPEPLGRPADPASGTIEALDSLVLSTPNPDRAAALTEPGLVSIWPSTGPFPPWIRGFCSSAAATTSSSRLSIASKTVLVQGPTRSGACPGGPRTSSPRRRGCGAAGLEVSDIRDGRKPGSRVATVKTGTFGVPTLLIQQGAEISGTSA